MQRIALNIWQNLPSRQLQQNRFTVLVPAATKVIFDGQKILQFRNTCSRRSRLSPAAKTFVVSASFFVVATFLMTPSYGMQIRQATDNRAEEEWLKSSEREVRTLDKIISNLYGRENPFNLLTKRGGGVGAAKHSSASNAAAANKLEKRFAKHLNQLAKDGAEIGLLRSNDGWFFKNVFVIFND